MRFQAVLFDVGNTLLHVPHDPHQRAINAASHLGEITFKAYKAGLQRARQEWWDSGGTQEEQDLPTTWISHIERALDLIDFEGDSARAAQLIEDSFLLDGWEVYPDVVQVLEQIRARGLRMGVVSNWPPTLETTLETAGLRHFFEEVVVSGVEGYAKPHPQLFQLAFQRLELFPEAALFVGDSMEHDVEGARAVGMSSVLIDRHDDNVDHSARITSLHELLDHLP